MNAGTLKMTGIAGLVWGVLTILVFIIGIVVGVRAVQGAGAGGSAMIIKVLGLLSALALIWMLFQLSKILGGMGAIACYVVIGVVILNQVLGFVGVASAGIALILLVLQGGGLIAVGVFGLMGRHFTSGSYKAFHIVLIIFGAFILLAFLVVTALIAPFLALAAGILLFVAMNGAAKQAV